MDKREYEAGGPPDVIQFPVQRGRAEMACIVQELFGPLLESIGRMLEQNQRAMEQIAAAQQAASERITALEKRVRLQTPLSKTQEKCVNGAIRDRARELLGARGCDGDRKAVNKLSGMIRRSVLQRYGAGSLREAPAYDYETMIRQIAMWAQMTKIRDVVREARERAKDDMDGIEPDSGMDGETARAGRVD